MPVRLTLHPDEDVELPEGARLGDLRAPLADLVRRPELLRAELIADDRPVGDDARVGRRPLLPGAVLSVAGPGGGRLPAADVAALRSRWFLTAASGLRAGEPRVLAVGAPLTLGQRDARVRVTVDTRDRVRVRRLPRRAAPHRVPRPVTRGPRWRRPVALAPPAGRTRRLGPWPRRWRPGTELDLDGSRFALHASGDVDVWLGPPAAAPDRPAGAGPAMLITGLVPVLGSVVLAVTLRQPLYALFSLVAVIALVPQVAAVRRRRWGAADPVPLAPPPVGADPGRTGARTAAAHQASDGAWLRVRRAHAAARSAAGTAPSAPTLQTLLPDGALSVRGPAAPVRSVGRAVVVDLAAAGAAVEVLGDGRDAWRWCRWISPGDDGTDSSGPSRVLVVDSPRPEDLAAADRAARRGDVVVLCLPDDGRDPAPREPAWCRTRWDVTPDGRVLRTAPDGTDTLVAATGVTVAWAERTARRLAGLRALGRDPARLGEETTPDRSDDRSDPTDPRIPATVALRDLLDGSEPAARWARARGWTIPLGRGADGTPVVLDLVADGPHLLVAGTTGAGKSELLQSLVLALAATRSPADLSLALVDFKGGASFGRCADLPHVVGQVTDLEPGLAGRALTGLRAELRRRERLLADHGVATSDDLPAGTLPRLVVVIDEFRALADDLPEFLPGLLRIAAQGRSLGVHLVLATQRPAGAVSADLRANVTTRIALRVVDVADSRDVVEHPAAAAIRVGDPGRAVLRIGSAPPLAVQCAHAGARGDGTAGPVRRVPTGWTAGRHDSPPVRTDRSADAGDPVADLVADLRRAAHGLGHRPGPAPWLPPLPDQVGADDVRPGDEDPPPGPDRLPLALADDPDGQRRLLACWRPHDGHLAVLGAARSGRTTVLATLAHAALAGGWSVHVLAPDAAHRAFTPFADHPGFGTLAGADDPRRTRRLLRLLAAAPDRADGSRTLVLVDDAPGLRAALATSDPWDPLVTALAAGRAAFAVTADSATVGGLAARVGPRVVMLGNDPHTAVMLGVPQPFAGAGGPPGRAVLLGNHEPQLCQVLLPGHPPAAALPAPSGGERTPRVLPLPTEVAAAELDLARRDRRATGTAVLVGLGGDAAEPVALDVGAGALVVGPRGAGRSTVLCTVARALAAAGRLAGVVSRDPAVRAAAGDAPTAGRTSVGVRELVGSLTAAGGTLVVDDLDVVTQSCPVEADRLAALVDDGLTVVASATTQGAVMAHRGVLAELRGRRTGVVLAPGERGADEVLGTVVSEVADPGPPRPGRGALVQAGHAVCVQVVRIDAEPDGSAERVLDDPPRHEADQDDGSQQEHQHPAERRGDGPAGEQRDAEQPLEDLPAGDGRAAASTSLPQRTRGPGQEPRQREEERHREEADPEADGPTSHEVDDHRAGEDHHRQDLETDHADDRDQGPRRTRRGTGVSRVGGGVGGGHRGDDKADQARCAV
ncbi:FtsK/SpoIIIE domain-containing protein [Isoptericola sediminis]|uniref:FtsK domain-containing protein n=1 Tax=Isoptericola sediminis TaxID=2733572 RepID=A0A849JXS1_9MICO|nr:FtsK/SpoIIIE domain-containing protein [Isoptericola sediminis]NNU28112.1 hypothetical protein [Isoptericola sediminis]